MTTSTGPEATGERTDGRRGDGRRSGAVTVLLMLVVAGAGFVVACLASLVSRIVWRVDPVAVPWGLVLAVGGSVALVVLAREIRRGAGFAAAGGWLVGLFYVFNPRAEGDYVIADDGLGLTWLLVSILAVMAAAAWGSTSP